MTVQNAYNSWAAQYDSNENKTRDLEAITLRKVLENIQFSHCLEIGCGTGKNTSWLLTKAIQVTAVDFSAEMLNKAKHKISSGNVQFIEADINQEWNLPNNNDLVTFSLVLEHIKNLEPIFIQAANHLVPGGHVYIGELHPFKQYTGSKARFETNDGLKIVECYNHHISDFINAALNAGLRLSMLTESFDNDDRSLLPRILCIVFQKPA